MYESIKYTDLLRQNAQLASSTGAQLRIAVLANITIASIKEILEFSLRSRGINAVVTVGDYDNVAQNSARFRDYDAVLLFYELAGIVDNLPFELHHIDVVGIEALIEKAQRDLSFTFEALAGSRLVVCNLLSALPFTLDAQRTTSLDRICERTNEFIRRNAPRAFKLVNLDKIFAHCSVHAAIDLRFYLSSRSLYQFNFLRTYCEFIYPIVGSTAGQYKKVLVLDCDNTLWNGVVGEDGLTGIRVYTEIQSLAVQLAQSGVLVCLCSKNNPEDVDAVLDDPRTVLRDEHLIVKAVNWQDKTDNLLRIAATLNLGLDCFVFLDDSDFELEGIRQRAPAVTLFKVPASYAEYLWLFQSICGLFYRESDTEDDRTKIAQYKMEFARQEQQTRFDQLDDYLSSLGLSIKLTINSTALVPRLAQLTQKTNQFNLTTRRMTESEVGIASASADRLVIGIDVCDRFGSYGTTGLIVVRQRGSEADIESFLLSCRVIGRGVELKAFDCIVALLRGRGVKRLYGAYVKTRKNEQVMDFYSKLRFRSIGGDAEVSRYELDIDSYNNSSPNYIRVEKCEIE